METKWQKKRKKKAKREEAGQKMERNRYRF